MFNVSKKPENYTPEELFSELKSKKFIDCLASHHQQPHCKLIYFFFFLIS
jgi:hypothetical protein